MGPIDGTIVRSASAGSLPFLPADGYVRRAAKYSYTFSSGALACHGFVNAFNPLTGWYDQDVVGLGLGITLLMVENYRSQLVWNTFMKNPEISSAMVLLGFQPN
jgi:hypothetical protein